MILVKSVQELNSWRSSKKETVGFVPTMGALHAGHMKLIEKSKNEMDHTVLSIFVNPLQFNNQSDFTNYPKTLETDLKMAEAHGVDVVFAPDRNQIYQNQNPVTLNENEISLEMEGQYRPGHFSGVLTVVLKLFNLVKPHRAFFGLKDYQQFLLIKKMSEDLFLDVEVVGVDTVRDEKGLALSSRNSRLNTDEIKLAQNINVILKTSKSPEEASLKLSNIGFKVDYVKDLWGRRFMAAFLRDVRLIDNVEL